jgi:hypothetical protein
MGGDSLCLKPLCPACGRPMGLTRTVPASPSYDELRTYTRKEANVSFERNLTTVSGWTTAAPSLRGTGPGSGSSKTAYLQSGAG